MTWARTRCRRANTGNKFVEEEDTIENLITTLKEEIQYVDVFIIAFKQSDNRMTDSLRSMISLFEKMFGHKFWENVILEVCRLKSQFLKLFNFS